MSAYGYGGKPDQPSPVDVLKKRVRDGKLQGVFLFWGAEEYTKDFYAEKIRALVKDSPLPEFNYILFDAEKQKPGELADAIETLPYMWDSKVIEIRGLTPSRCSVEDGEQIADLLSAVPDYLTVLILLRADDFDGSVKAGKAGQKDEQKAGEADAKKGNRKSGFGLVFDAVSASGLAVEFEPEKGDKLVAWVEKHFAAKKVAVDSGLPAALIGYCGTDMYILQSEIRKLCDVYAGSPLTERDVRTYCCSNESAVMFDIAACMTRHDIAGARKIFTSLRMTPETVPQTVGYLASHYQMMLLVRAGLDAGMGVNRIAAEQKLPVWRVSKAAQSLQAGNVTAEQLKYAVGEIAETDRRIKNRRGNPAAMLELLIYRICCHAG